MLKVAVFDKKLDLEDLQSMKNARQLNFIPERGLDDAFNGISVISADLASWRHKVEDEVGKGNSVILCSYDLLDACEAINLGAEAFLPKPVDGQRLISAINRIDLKRRQKTQIIGTGLEQMAPKLPIERYGILVNGGVKLYKADEIVYLEADNNYSVIYDKKGDKLISSKTLKQFEEVLDPSSFLRIHKSYIVNLERIESMRTTGNVGIKLDTGKVLPVSRRRKTQLVSAFRLI